MRQNRLASWLPPAAAGLCLAAAGLMGCGSSPALRAADAGDIDALRTSLEQRAAEGDVDVAEAREVATHVVRQSITTAQGSLGAARLESIEDTCAARFDDALAQRAEHEDDVGAVAAIKRIDIGEVETMTRPDLVSHADDGWRAVGARSLGVRALSRVAVGESDAEQLAWAATWRRQLMTDPARIVRKAALQAARDARDPGDAAAVLEAARLDPYEEVRLEALKAAGAIASRDTVLGLKDLWARVGEDERLAIVSAWEASWRSVEEPIACEPRELHPSCEARRQLVNAADAGNGMTSLRAAQALMRGVDPSAAGTPEGNAAAVVERLIDDGSGRVRVAAIEAAPLSWARLTEAIVAASEDGDERVAAAALSRMTELGGKEREAALAKLRELAKKTGPGGDLAKAGLAAAGDDGVVALLDVDAKDVSRGQRVRTAERYAQLGRADRAMTMLADQDPAVRVQVACVIIAMDE